MNEGLNVQSVILKLKNRDYLNDFGIEKDFPRSPLKAQAEQKTIDKRPLDNTVKVLHQPLVIQATNWAQDSYKEDHDGYNVKDLCIAYRKANDKIMGAGRE